MSLKEAKRGDICPVLNQIFKTMITTKRTTNRAALKFKFLGATNFKPSRYKVTQTNTRESVYMSSNFGSCAPLEGICMMLDCINEIEDYSLIIDNTQNDYYLFCINTKDKTTCPSLLNHFKK